MKFSRKLIAFGLCLFCAASLFALEGVVLSVSGKVEIQDGDDWIPLEEDDILDAGSVISTGFKSECVIALDETTLTVKALTRLTLEQLFEQEGNKASTMYLDAGSISASVRSEEDKKVAFKVKTPAVTASVRGTDGDVYINRIEGRSGSWLLTPPEPRMTKEEIIQLAEMAKEILRQELGLAGSDSSSDAAEVAEGADASESTETDESAEDTETAVAVADNDEASGTEGAESSEADESTGSTETAVAAADTDAAGDAAGAESAGSSGSESTSTVTETAVAQTDTSQTPAASSAESSAATTAPAAAAAPSAVASTPAPAAPAFDFNNYFSSLDQVGGVIVHQGETSTVATVSGGTFALNTPQQMAVESATSLGSSTSTPSSQESVTAAVPQTPAAVVPTPEVAKKATGTIIIKPVFKDPN